MRKQSTKRSDIVSRVVLLLDEIAKLMNKEPAIDQQTFEYLSQLQMRVRFLAWNEHSATLPSKAPARWLDRFNRKESPIEFIRREYSRWLGRGLSRPLIRKLDSSLYAALCNWISEHGELPQDIDLPTKKELNDQRLKEMEYASKGPPSEQREALRLYHAARRRSSARRGGSE